VPFLKYNVDRIGRSCVGLSRRVLTTVTLILQSEPV